MLQDRLLPAGIGFCLSWAAWRPPSLAGRLPAGKARLARRPQALNGGADVCKSLVKGPAPSTQLHGMAEPWLKAPQRRAAWPTLAELAGSSAPGASEPRQLVATNGTATCHD